MEQGFFANLPSEMTINILSRLPARTATSCKCVCKPWLNILESEEFVKSHMSKSVPGLALLDVESLTLLEFEDDHLQDLENDENRSIPLQTKTSLVTSFHVYTYGRVLCSANGLLLLRGVTSNSRYSLSICNPITREFIELHCPNHRENNKLSCCWEGAVYGFGASKNNGQLKVVKMNPLDQYPHCEAHVYVLGTCSWRRIETVPLFLAACNTNGALVNGNLHWLMYDFLNGSQLIYTFDLETEVFRSLISPPPSQPDNMGELILGAVGDCLCVCDDSAEGTVIVWLMKEYGDEKSWSKEFVISIDRLTFVSPIRILKDGEILVANAGQNLVYYTKNEKSGGRIQQTTKQRLFIIHAVTHTSTFLSLKTFQMEGVSFF